jgi:hypothetical protein
MAQLQRKEFCSSSQKDGKQQMLKRVKDFA